MTPERFDLQALARRTRVPLLLLLAVLTIGSLGFWALWRPYDATVLDAVYMTFITVTTVGYNEVHPLDARGRILSIAVSLAGIGSLFYLFGVVMEYLVARELHDPRGRRAMQRTIDGLERHIVVAGFGRMGRRAAEELAAEGAPFVVIDRDPAAAEACRGLGWLVVAGDAEEDDVLAAAGVERAAGMVVATASDAANAFVVMSARAMNPELTIVTRADDGDSVRKLERAGADRAVDLYTLGGQRLVSALLRPAAIEFFSGTLRQRRRELAIEDVPIGHEELAGQSLRSLDLRARTGASVLAVLRGDATLPNPDPDEVLRLDDHLVVLGTPEHVAALRRLVGAAAVGADVAAGPSEGDDANGREEAKGESEGAATGAAPPKR